VEFFEFGYLEYGASFPGAVADGPPPTPPPLLHSVESVITVLSSRRGVVVAVWAVTIQEDATRRPRRCSRTNLKNQTPKTIKNTAPLRMGPYATVILILVLATLGVLAHPFPHLCKRLRVTASA
jgi:hypothetical protein